MVILLTLPLWGVSDHYLEITRKIISIGTIRIPLYPVVSYVMPTTPFLFSVPLLSLDPADSKPALTRIWIFAKVLHNFRHRINTPYRGKYGSYI